MVTKVTEHKLKHLHKENQLESTRRGRIRKDRPRNLGMTPAND